MITSELILFLLIVVLPVKTFCILCPGCVFLFVSSETLQSIYVIGQETLSAVKDSLRHIRVTSAICEYMYICITVTWSVQLKVCQRVTGSYTGVYSSHSCIVLLVMHLLSIPHSSVKAQFKSRSFKSVYVPLFQHYQPLKPRV